MDNILLKALAQPDKDFEERSRRQVLLSAGAAKMVLPRGS